MTDEENRILTISAKKLFSCYPKETKDKAFCMDTTQHQYFSTVVMQEEVMDECPLRYQLEEVLKKKPEASRSLYDKFLIVDFEDIFVSDKKNRESEQLNAKDLIENGLDLHFEDHDVHMVAFDKSNSMSRKSRISFIDSSYYDEMNQRLNLDIPFDKIDVVLSKYYAYRGLYLSSSRRVLQEKGKFELTPETIVVIQDNRMYKLQNGGERPVTGYPYSRDVPILSATKSKNNDWKFENHKEDIKNVDIPYDGEGFISPEYAKYINERLGLENVTSFQVRLPFIKGMLHQVDVHEFLNEYDHELYLKTEYMYEDAFGIQRNLKKAQIFITESMFKGMKWLNEECKYSNQDPMIYYCDQLKKYNHNLFISGTSEPYGNSKYTQLSYQMINTIKFTDQQFDNVINKHKELIKNPIRYLEDAETIQIKNDNKKEKKQNWLKIVKQYPEYKDDIFIKQQLAYTQRSLLTKIAEGKLVVEGQTRYLCRDLLPLLASLLKEVSLISKYYKQYLYTRFYLPTGNTEYTLEYANNYAFFRSPHLSRNEQAIMKPFVDVVNEYEPEGTRTFEQNKKYLDLYNTYFNHLTGIVMIPRGSMLPLGLGGADFDGDLVTIVGDQDVVEAVKAGVYDRETTWKRVLPYIKIPTTKAKAEKVPKHIKFEHLKNTFSNRIGIISNAAIAIGQKEYDRKSEQEEDYRTEDPTCWKCTLLTGLEIDAAKNGEHPNLDSITKGNTSTCAYLKFLKDFRTLTTERNFQFSKLNVKTDGKTITLSASNCKTIVEYKCSEEGTYINLLPIKFVESFNQYKESQKSKKKLSKINSMENDDFVKTSQSIMDLHFYYREFLKNLRSEKNKPLKDDKNLRRFVNILYDRDYKERILNEVIPSLKMKLQPYVIGRGDIKARINDKQWLLQSDETKGETLEAIIGNGFKISILTEEEKEFLFHFKNQGYKILWYLLENVQGTILESYEKKMDSYWKNQKVTIPKNLTSFKKELDSLMKQYYEKNTANMSRVLYTKCLEELKSNIKNHEKEYGGIENIVPVLYKATDSRINYREFFWDAFTYEQLESFVKGKGK